MRRSTLKTRAVVIKANQYWLLLSSSPERYCRNEPQLEHCRCKWLKNVAEYQQFHLTADSNRLKDFDIRGDLWVRDVSKLCEGNLVDISMRGRVTCWEACVLRTSTNASTTALIESTPDGALLGVSDERDQGDEKLDIQREGNRVWKVRGARRVQTSPQQTHINTHMFATIIL